MSLPKTMRAVVLTGHGGLDKLSYVEDWPTPEAGPGEVVVKVGACGLNNTDINTRPAWYSKAVSAGITDTNERRSRLPGPNSAVAVPAASAVGHRTDSRRSR